MRIKTTRKLFKNSKYSYAVTISPRIVKELRWRNKQKLTVIGSGKTGKIIIKDWEK